MIASVGASCPRDLPTPQHVTRLASALVTPQACNEPVEKGSDMWVCACFTWFVVYSVFGWIYESTYCTIVERKWANRGFLYGPVCPIYGTGIVAMMLIWGNLVAQGVVLTWWQVFLIAFFGSAVLEYVTHWVLEKLFHAYWWNYSNMPLNLNGRICLPASILFGLGGLLVVYVLYGPTMDLTAKVDPLAFEAFALVLMACMAADTAITVSALNSVARAASALNRSLNDHMDQFVIDVQERGSAVAGQLQERTEAAAAQLQEGKEAVARERERFARILRDRQLGGMSHMAREALRRTQALARPERVAELPGMEQLAMMWSEVRSKHWPDE